MYRVRKTTNNAIKFIIVFYYLMLTQIFSDFPPSWKNMLWVHDFDEIISSKNYSCEG